LSTEERRRYPRTRAPGSLLVAWQTGDRKAVSRLETIALGGLFIRTAAPAASESLVRVLVEAPNGDVRARAIVRRVVANQGMGLEFVAMTQEDRGRLIQYMHRLVAA
jgi:c-di-GMP-binding flagellar brake protein YcgR